MVSSRYVGLLLLSTHINHDFYTIKIRVGAIYAAVSLCSKVRPETFILPVQEWQQSHLIRRKVQLKAYRCGHHLRNSYFARGSRLIGTPKPSTCSCRQVLISARHLPLELWRSYSYSTTSPAPMCTVQVDRAHSYFLCGFAYSTTRRSPRWFSG